MEKEAQDQKVLKWLTSGKSLTSMSAIKMWKHTRLSRSIHTLRASYTIYGKLVKHKDAMHKVYYMENSSLFIVHGESF